MDNDDLDALRATGLKVVVVNSPEDLDNFFNSLPPAKVEELPPSSWEDEARRAMQNFVDKVECGMAKSQSSYSWFKKLLVVPPSAAAPSRAPASVQDEPWKKGDGETNAMYLERQARIAGEPK